MVKTEICMVKDPEAPESREILRRAARILKNGGLVVFPTETVYGLGADATDSDAAGRIYAAKGRPADNPLIVHVASADDVSRYAVETEESRRLMQVFWPGPLTVVLPARETIPSTVTAGLPTVAIRCPSHPVARALLMEVGIPIAAPSANLSGSPSPTCARHVADDMMGRVDMILDGGDCEIGLESTIVMPDKDGGLTLLRPGAVTPEMLRTVTPKLRIAEAVLGQLPEGNAPLSPGMKYRHYAPSSPLVLLDGDCHARQHYIEKQSGNIAVIGYEEDLPLLRRSLTEERLFSLGRQQDLSMQSHRLFTLLRDIDKQGFDKILAPLPPTGGMGMALYNRMIRAAAHCIVHLPKD